MEAAPPAADSSNVVVPLVIGDATGMQLACVEEVSPRQLYKILLALYIPLLFCTDMLVSPWEMK
jgi:hypothetical protein